MKKYKIIYYDDNIKNEIVDTDLDNFFRELFNLYDKYDISISHEDSHGSFVLRKNNLYNKNWIKNADICRWLGKEFCYSEEISDEQMD